MREALIDLTLSVVLVVVGGATMYLGFFRRGVRQGLKELWELDLMPGGARDWRPFMFIVSAMLIGIGAALTYRGIAIL